MPDEVTSVLGKQLGIWLTFAGVLVSGAVTGWTALQTAEIQRQQVVLQEKQQQNGFALDKVKSDLSVRQDDLSRLEFVKTLIPDALSSDPQRKATFLMLVQLTLSDDNYRSLVAALSNSSDPNLKEVGRSGTDALVEKDKQGSEEIIALIDKIKSDDKPTRLQSMDTIYSKYLGDSRAVQAVLDYLSAGATSPLHVQGRINALYILQNSKDGAWSPALLGSAAGILDGIEKGAADSSIGPPIGEQTREVLDAVRARLTSLTSAG